MDYNKEVFNNLTGKGVIEEEIDNLKEDLLNRKAEDVKADYLDYLCEKFLTTKKGYHVDRNTGIILRDGYHIENGLFVPDGYNYQDGQFVSADENNYTKKIK